VENTLLLELLDTSLKVALGALIAGVTAWWVMRRNAIVGSRSPQEDRRLSLLEEVSSQVGQVTHIFAKYSSLAAESVQFGERWPQARKQELDTVSADLVREFKCLADAESKLLMLGEKNLERSLRLYGSQIAVFRRQVYVGRGYQPGAGRRPQAGSGAHPGEVLRAAQPQVRPDTGQYLMAT